MHRRLGRRIPWQHAWRLAVAAGSALAPLPALAQPPAPAPAPTPTLAPAQAFDQLRPAATVPGPVGFGATRVWRWQSDGVQRLHLQGDVRLALGTYDFRARRATIWFTSTPTTDPAHSRVKVFAFLEDVGSAGDPAGASVAGADTLAVRGLFELDSPPALRADLLIDGRPDRPDAVASLDRADVALDHAWRRQQNLPITDASLPPLPVLRPAPAPTPQAPQPKPRLVARSKPLETPRGPAAVASANPPSPARRLPPISPPPPSQPSPSQPETRTPQPSQPQPRPTPPDTRRDAAAPPATNTPPGPTTNPPPTTPPTTPPPSREAAAQQPKPAPGAPIFAKEGIVTVAPKNFSIVSGTDESAINAWGGVSIQYADTATGRSLQLSAQRAVIFLDPGQIADLASFSAANIRGIYLEGDVSATDGQYTLRGPQIYYDLRANRAVMPDAVFWTYDEQRQLPVYVRATMLRQTAADSFAGEGAQVTNSAFFEPELSIGASTVTVERRPRQPGQEGSGLWVEAHNVTGRILGVPVAYWPTYAGDPEERLVKDIRVENRSGSGGAVLATLNANVLLGLKQHRGSTFDLLTDFYFERGPAIGAKAQWGDQGHLGSVFAYAVPFDRGIDLLKPGTRINREDDFRGVLTAQQRWTLDDHWTAFAELSYLSDENVIDAFFENLGETRREFRSRLAARYLKDNTYFNAELSGSLNDFLANEYLLESQGYSVTRLPEATYIRLADDVLHDSAPGVLTYFTESRAGLLQLNLDHPTAREHGFFFNSTSVPALGINPDQRLEDVLRSAGLFESPVMRLDTRHELSAQLASGPVHINPFIVARATFWDDSFDQFSPDENDQTRLWGAAGVRLSTTVQRIDDSVESRLLDLHRLRHTLEPNATFWVAGTSIDRADLPVYDQDVEGLPDGGMARIGLTQTFQTQRGGPGRWHATDLLTLSTDLIFSTDEAKARGPIGRFFDFRPEYSNPGNYFVGDLTVRVTDATSFTASSVYDLDANQQAATSIGIIFRQAPDFTASLDLRFLNPQDSTYLTLALSYELTRKYSVAFGAAYDTDEARFQYAALELRRKFQSSILGFVLTTNEITGETGIGIVLRPYGAAGEVGFSGQDTRVGGLGYLGNP